MGYWDINEEEFFSMSADQHYRWLENIDETHPRMEKMYFVYALLRPRLMEIISRSEDISLLTTIHGKANDIMRGTMLDYLCECYLDDGAYDGLPSYRTLEFFLIVLNKYQSVEVFIENYRNQKSKG